MLRGSCRQKTEELLVLADVRLDGDRPWDIQVHEDRFYARVLAWGSLGLGESYMAGWWDCEQLDEFFHRVLWGSLDTQVGEWAQLFPALKAKLFNAQMRSRAFRIGRRHYDIGNELYKRMLGPRMIYSGAYWKDATDLREAQEAKLDLVCRKLGLEAGMRLLDIGCGWGGTARFAAERYGVEVVGTTVSEEQVRSGREVCQGLPVEIRLQDYRDLDERFDRILSIGMFEHVGVKNYRTYMETIRRCLEEKGLFLLHTIGRNRSGFTSDPWMEQYIFPNSVLPSARQICAASEGLFVLEDWHSFGHDYDRTLMAWFRNFDASWGTIKERYEEPFYRMWKYYLLSCAGAFRAHMNQLWEVVFSPRGIPGGYQALR